MAKKRPIWRLPHLDDDGLITPKGHDYTKDKYRLVRHYAYMFTTSMKRKWTQLAYIDLFAGAGRSRIDNKTIVPASPLLTLELPSQFSKYIFCEQDEEKLSVLQTRVERIATASDVTYISGDVNKKVGDILSHLPTGKVLAFCFVDPYRIADLHFDSLRQLASRPVDFLVLLPSYMDVHRNPSIYTVKDNRALDDFLGSSAWRHDWQEAESKGEKLSLFFVSRFGDEMKKIGYLYPDIKEAKLVRTTKNVRLYHLAFFSRHPLGADFWKKAKDYGTDQRSLF